MSEEKIDIINKIGEGEGLEAAQEIHEPKQQLPTTAPNRDHFDSLMQEEKVAMPAPGERTSLMDAVRDMNFSGTNSGGKVSTQSLLAQTEQVISKIDAVRETLETPNINIKSATHVQLLENKLSHIDESLRIALTKAGVEYSPKDGVLVEAVGEKAKASNPIERFLGYVTDGQWQLENLYGELNGMAQQNKELSPASMLAIQIKVGQIGQELQLFYSLLSKGLESVKTIMNIQV